MQLQRYKAALSPLCLRLGLLVCSIEKCFLQGKLHVEKKINLHGPSRLPELVQDVRHAVEVCPDGRPLRRRVPLQGPGRKNASARGPRRPGVEELEPDVPRHEGPSPAQYRSVATLAEQRATVKNISFNDLRLPNTSIVQNHH